MPNTRSAAKRLRQNKVLTAAHRSIKSSMKTQMKKVISAAESGDIETAETQYRLAAKQIDRAGAKKVIHLNAAARQKSRLQRIIKAAKSDKG